MNFDFTLENRNGLVEFTIINLDMLSEFLESWGYLDSSELNELDNSDKIDFISDILILYLNEKIEEEEENNYGIFFDEIEEKEFSYLEKISDYVSRHDINELVEVNCKINL